MNSVVEQIKDRLPIAEVVGWYITLQKAGKYFRARSPFTNEKTPSFYVTPDKNLYHCFSSGKGGDIFSFVQEMEGVDFKGALKILAEKAGIELKPEPKEKKEERDRFFDILEDSSAWFQENLAKNSVASEYASGRSLKNETIQQWRIGYASNDWRSLYNFLTKVKKYSPNDVVSTGMCIRPDDRSKEPFDRFRNRLMFPILDQSGRVIAFTGRILPEATEAKSATASGMAQAKYLNSPDTLLYDKSKTVYGYHKAKHAVHTFGYWILVEGQMDLLLSHQHGFINTVATSGTALTEDQLHLLKRISDKLVIAYDSDKAGKNASKRAFDLALKLGFDIKIASPASAGIVGKDPADIIAENADSWKEILKSTVSIIDFELQNAMAGEKGGEKTGDQRQKLLAVSRDVLPLVALVSSHTEKAYYIKKIAEALATDERVVWDEYQRVSKNDPSKEAVGSVPKELESTSTKFASPEEMLCAILWWKEGDLSNDQLTQKLGADQMASLFKAHEARKADLILIAEMNFSSVDSKTHETIVNDLVNRVYLHTIKKEREEIGRKIQQNNFDEALLKKYQELSAILNI